MLNLYRSRGKGIHMFCLPVQFIPLKKNARYFSFLQFLNVIISVFYFFFLNLNFYKSFHVDRAKSQDLFCINVLLKENHVLSVISFTDQDLSQTLFHPITNWRLIQFCFYIP